MQVERSNIRVCFEPLLGGGAAEYLHADHVYRAGMTRQRLEVLRIGGQDSAARFGVRHDESVDSGPAPSASPEQCSASSERLG